MRSGLLGSVDSATNPAGHTMSVTGSPDSAATTIPRGRAWDIVIGFIRRRAAGEQISPAQLIAAHPDIPELASEFAKLERIQGAVRGTIDLAVSGGSTVEHTPTSESIAAAPEPSPDTFPGYADCKVLGKGGQGLVYRAFQQGTNREVAIKVLLEGRDASAPSLRRFEREIEIAAKLKHPNIVTVFHSGITETGVPFYVMDFVDGVPLTTFARLKDLTADRAIRLFCRVCEAVQYAHLHGVIHRDLKPSNVLVDESGEPRILDFGLARLVTSAPDSIITVDESLLGTVPYMSPEQVHGHNDELDARTDVYSLGVMLYQLLTGKFPYAVIGPLIEVLNNIRSVDPADPRRNWSADSGISARKGRRHRRICPIDRDIETIILKALQKQPHRRYQSAGDLARDLTYYLIGNPIEARRDSLSYVLGKYIRRNRAATVGLLSVLTAICSAAYIAGFSVHERVIAEEEKAEEQRRAAARALDAEAMQTAIARRMNFAWFIGEWEAGRDDSARSILESYFQSAPEYPALKFLLDPQVSPDEMIRGLAPEWRFIGSFAAGERAMRDHDAGNAADWFRRTLKEDPIGLLSSQTRARLKQLDSKEQAN